MSCDVNIKIYRLHIALVINAQEDISRLQYYIMKKFVKVISK